MRRDRGLLFVGGAGLGLAVLGPLDPLGPLAAKGVTVAGSVALALLAHGAPAPTTVADASGAVALTSEAARSTWPLIASGLLLTFVFGTRATRSRTWCELAFHLAAAFAGGVAASWVARAHAGLETSLWLTAVAVAALLSSLPWVVPSDAPRTFALRRLAARTRGPLRARLLRAVVAHRRLADLELPRRLRRRVDGAFDDVIRRAEHQIDREGGAPIEDTVRQLCRIARATRGRGALEAEASALFQLT